MSAYQDRIEGVMLGTAAGDALGASYEFRPPVHASEKVHMRPSHIWKAGQWTDDTSMAIAIAERAARGEDLRDEATQDAIVARWHDWSLESPDVGVQTRAVLSRAATGGGITAASARAESKRLHEETGRAGNGSLMRTAPVALAYLDDEKAMVQAARALSELTHFDPRAGDACVIWCCAIRHAVLTGEIDVRIGLGHLAPRRRAKWEGYLAEAEEARPADFENNGFVVQALQGAWSAIHNTPEPKDDPKAGVFRADRLRLALEAAVRGGRDADTVAAIAGGLLGAAYGASAVPLEWRAMLNGWPSGANARTLVKLATAIRRGGRPDTTDLAYRYAEADRMPRHPYDDKVVLGTVAVLRDLPKDITAVVSMCRLRDDDIRTDMPHVEVRLIDMVDPDENPHLEYVLLQAVTAVERLRARGHTVLVHCVNAMSRTPALGALYGIRHSGVSAQQAIDDVCERLPDADPNPAFREALRRLQHLRPEESA